jgi:hypothetical protein
MVGAPCKPTTLILHPLHPSRTAGGVCCSRLCRRAGSVVVRGQRCVSFVFTSPWRLRRVAVAVALASRCAGGWWVIVEAVWEIELGQDFGREFLIRKPPVTRIKLKI